MSADDKRAESPLPCGCEEEETLEWLSSHGEEDEELISEFRELYQSVLLAGDDSSESVDSEDAEHLKMKLHVLKQYVSELRESYEELLRAFSQLEGSAREKVSRLDARLADTLASAKEFQQQAQDLERQLAELRRRYGEAEQEMGRLEGENGKLEGENGRLEGERRLRVRERDSLWKESDRSEAVEHDLGHVLQLIADGVESGSLKLSEVAVQTQSVSFPHEDLPLGPCGHQPQLEWWEEEVGRVRGELGEREQELEQLQEKVRELEQQREYDFPEVREGDFPAYRMEMPVQERAQVDQQLCESQAVVVRLETECEMLSSQLDEAEQRQQGLSEALAASREAMELYQKTSQQDLEHRDEELARLRGELAVMEQQRVLLEEQVEISQSEVRRLEEEHGQAQEEVAALQGQVEGLVLEVEGSGASLEEARQRVESLLQDMERHQEELEQVRGEKNQLERQLADRVAELQAQISNAKHHKIDAERQVSDHKLQLETMAVLHSSCQEDAEKMRAVLESKEADLSRTIAALQVAAAQIAALHRKPGEGTRTPETVSEELSQCELAVHVLERELSEHRGHWEETMASIDRHKVFVTELTTQRDRLQAEIQQRESRVAELEALLEEVSAHRDSLRQSAEEHEASVGRLEEELQQTRAQREEALQEVIDLQMGLASTESDLEEQQQLLSAELLRRDESLEQLQADYQAVQQRYEACCQQIETVEEAKGVLQQAYKRMVGELEASEAMVGELEQQVEAERERGEGEVERCAQVIAELREHLRESEEERRAQQEKALSEGSEMARLQSQHSALVGRLKEREELLQRLQDETAFLGKQHQDTLHEVERRQHLVDSLQEDLSSSQGLCDGLQHEVAEFEHQLEELGEELKSSEQEKQKLRQQVQQLGGDLEALRRELASSSQKCSDLERRREEEVEALQRELETARADHAHSEDQRELLERTADEQRGQLVELRLAVSDLELQRESLQFQGSSHEGVIGSLKSQISVLETALRETEKKRDDVDHELAASRAQCEMLEAQLAATSEKVVAVEHSREVAEGIGRERLSEISRLQQSLEEQRMREGLVRELREQLSSLEEQLTRLHSELSSSRERARQADRARAAAEGLCGEREAEVRGLRGRLEEEQGRGEQVEGLQEQVVQLTTELEIAQDEVLALQAGVRTARERDHQWSTELTHCTSELKLQQECVRRLEREVGEREREVDQLTRDLQATQRMHHITREELASGHQLEDNLHHQLSEKRQEILDLEHQLGLYRRDIATLRGQLAASEEARQRMMQRMGDLEEQYDGLHRSQSRAELELVSTRANLEDRKVYCQQLQEDCEHITDRVSSWARDARSSSETLAEKIREQESTIAALRSTIRELQAQKESLLSTVSDLRSRVSSESHPEGSSKLSSGSITSLTARFDVNISGVSTGLPVGEATATATVPLTFDSQYRDTLEQGMSGASVESPPRFRGEGEGAPLDKDYWIHRAGELSVQLQQSSEYWSQKVRELSIELEKCKQAQMHLD